MLAAIVFTDVAGFSRRVQTHEADTLKLLERDFVAMRAFSAMHSGRVVKSTGDGLLLFFSSAVQAVEWALKTQRHFADQAAELPKDEVLRHRVGVHLGDVILSGGDVMGDGVNIAARLQAEAPPGGICISQVVYGVVKNKLKLDVVRLELKQLKNIAEPVQMYRVLLEPPVQRVPTAAPPAAEVEAASTKGAGTTKKIALAAAAVVVAGVAAALLWQAHRDHQTELARSHELRNALGAAESREPVATPAKSALSTPPTSEPIRVTTVPPSVAPAAPVAPVAEAFDFAKLALNRPPGGPAAPDESRLLAAANACLGPLEAWTPLAMQRYTRDTPLSVSPLRPGLQGSLLFTDTSRQLHFSQGGATRKQSWQDLKPEVHGAIVASLLRYSPSAPPRDVVRGAEAYAFIHRLPEMAEALLRERKAP